MTAFSAPSGVSKRHTLSVDIGLLSQGACGALPGQIVGARPEVGLPWRG
jgi:hypothetical protein